MGLKEKHDIDRLDNAHAVSLLVEKGWWIQNLRAVSVLS